MNIKIHNKNRLISYLFLFLVLAGLLVYFSGCTEKEEDVDPDRYSFWQGDIPNYYFCLDMNDNPLHKVNGRPYMILEYDPLTGVPLKCEFGLSDAVNEYLDGVEFPIPEPFMSSGSFLYAERLNLEGPVSLLSNWDEVSSHKALSAGGFEFWINKSNGETLHFIFTFDGMEGEILNPDAEWAERVSDIKAFKLLRKFNSNTVAN